MLPTYLVTGGAGFIGSAFVKDVLARGDVRVVTLDKLTYAGNRENLRFGQGDQEGRHDFVRGDIGDRTLLARLFAEHRPVAVVNFAAESHVDRSIDGARPFINTNLVGTFELLEASRRYHGSLHPSQALAFRFLHVSTDEVFGSLAETGSFSEGSAWAPSSPYAATKAGGNHLVRAYHQTYGLPTVTTLGSNTFGPYQLPEKLIPLVILSALEGRPLPLYGDGLHVRDWLYVDDHVGALKSALARGTPGETYAVGGGNERANLDVVSAICELLDELAPAGPTPGANGPRVRGSFRDLIAFVADRPGHDRRYALDTAKARRELGWVARYAFKDGLRRTVVWYLENKAWCVEAAARVALAERRGLGAPHSSSVGDDKS